MAMSDAKKRANQKWNQENMTKIYDRLNVLVPKGQREAIKSFAASLGESLNSYINRLIKEDMQKDPTSGVKTEPSRPSTTRAISYKDLMDEEESRDEQPQEVVKKKLPPKHNKVLKPANK